MERRTIKFLGKELTVTLRDDIDALVFEEIFKHRVYRGAEAYLASLDGLNWPIIDAGAHSGWFTLYCRCFNQIAPILALEPEPENFKALTKTCLEQKLKKVKCLEKALGAKNGEGQLILNKDNHNHYLWNGEGELPENNIPVQTITLTRLCHDEKIKTVGLLKMDIEGGEYEVFESMAKKDYNIVRAVLLEYHHLGNRDEKVIAAKLREHGFGAQIFPSKFDKKMGIVWGVNKR